MPKKESTLVNALLLAAYAAGGVLSIIFVPPYERGRRMLYGSHNYDSYRNTVNHLRRRGLISVEKKGSKKFIKLTKKGELEVLLAKAKFTKNRKWDGKWRIIIFDIPEYAKSQRNQLRGLLKKNNFKKLQASVYASPHPLNREALVYLQETKLIDFIRILKVEEMDNDQDLKKKFGLK